jgi:hypothetical protein
MGMKNLRVPRERVTASRPRALLSTPAAQFDEPGATAHDTIAASPYGRSATGNEEAFNLSLRKFLKTFGVTAQREIERAVQNAMEAGSLTGQQTLTATATVRIEAIGLSETIQGEITVG